MSDNIYKETLRGRTLNPKPCELRNIERKKMAHPIVGQGGFNVAELRNMGAFEAIERKPIKSGQTRSQAI